MSARTRRRAGRITLAVIKDVVLFTIGAALIIRQGFVVPPQDFNWVAMAFGAVIAGAPGALQLWGLRAALPSPIDGSSSSQAAEQSSPQ